MTTIIYDKYKFEIEIIGSRLYIKLTDTELLDVYESSVEEAEIYVKPIKKFYSMIEKSLNKEPNYNLIITNKRDQIICSFSYKNEMLYIEELVTFTKVVSDKTKELLLVECVKELTIRIEVLTRQVKELKKEVIIEFGYRNFGEKMIFNINSDVIDFRPFNSFTLYPNLHDYNKLTKTRKIIMNANSSVYVYSGLKLEYSSVWMCKGPKREPEFKIDSRTIATNQSHRFSCGHPSYTICEFSPPYIKCENKDSN
jgi:hypothetical protein